MQLASVIVTAPDQLREQLRGPTPDACSSAAAACAIAPAQPGRARARLVLRTLARRAKAASVEADELEAEFLAHIRVL